MWFFSVCGRMTRGSRKGKDLWPFVSLWKVQRLSQFHQIGFTNCEPKESLKMICELPPELDEGQMFAG